MCPKKTSDLGVYSGKKIYAVRQKFAEITSKTFGCFFFPLTVPINRLETMSKYDYFQTTSTKLVSTPLMKVLIIGILYNSRKDSV